MNMKARKYLTDLLPLASSATNNEQLQIQGTSAKFAWSAIVNVPNVARAVLATMSCAAGCSTPAPAPAPVSDPVRVTATVADIAGCNLLGKVIVSDSAPDPAKAALDETASLGGNVLLRKNEQVWNGNAYHCPAAGEMR